MMMKKTLLQPKKVVEREPKQRKELFRTKCKIERKCCNLIIVGGSSYNCVSMEVANQLNLWCTPSRGI